MEQNGARRELYALLNHAYSSFNVVTPSLINELLDSHSSSLIAIITAHRFPYYMLCSSSPPLEPYIGSMGMRVERSLRQPEISIRSASSAAVAEIFKLRLLQRLYGTALSTIPTQSKIGVLNLGHQANAIAESLSAQLGRHARSYIDRREVKAPTIPSASYG